jgi:hypothetical protein
LFSIRNDMDEHVVKMIKQFAICNSSPATAIRMLHAMGDRLYERQTVSTIFNKTNAALLDEMGADTTATKAQPLVNYILHNPIVNGVILLHAPRSNTFGKRGREDPTRHVEKLGHASKDGKRRNTSGRGGFMYSLQKIILKHVVVLFTFLNLMQCYCTVSGVQTRSYAWIPCLVLFLHVTPL